VDRKIGLSFGFIVALALLIIALISLFVGCASAPKHEETYCLVCPRCGTKFVPQDVKQNALNRCPNNDCRAAIPYIKTAPVKKSRSWGFYYEDWGRPYWSSRYYNPYGYDGGVRTYRYNTYRYYHYGNRRW